jgi:hypothetical protein
MLMHRVRRLHTRLVPHYVFVVEAILPFILMFVFMVPHVFAVIRFTDRWLLVYSPLPGAVTKHEFHFTYTTATDIGSLVFLYCNDGIPTDPCHPPIGVDTSNATLVKQTGETGYHISFKNSNEIILSRDAAAPVDVTPSVYTFDGIKNPTDMSIPYAVRLADYPTLDASGPNVDLGTVIQRPIPSLYVETQVPPMLQFCVAQTVSLDCTQEDGGNYQDLGDLTPNHTLTASSQMAAATNASNGYAITAYGTTMEAGTHVIDALKTPTASITGSNQFGINLATNNVPGVGSLGADPDGSFMNYTVNPDFSQPNKFMYANGTVVATAEHVSLQKRFTVSYIVNAAANLKAGVYTTTITYICSGRF